MSQGNTQGTKPVKLSGKFAIEVAMPNNRQGAFGPTLATLRGRWDYSQVAGQQTMDQFSLLQRAFPVIHGQCIEIDIDNRRLRIFDYYGQSDKAGEWQQLKGHLDKMHAINSVFKTDSPVPETVQERATDDQIKEWMYACRNWLDKGKAVELTGEGRRRWPDMDTIRALPGKRQTNHFEIIRPIKQYADEVPAQ